MEKEIKAMIKRGRKQFIKKLTKKEFYKEAGFPLTEKETPFNLSEKIKPIMEGAAYHGDEPMIFIEDVKEFVRRLKEEHMKHTKDDYMLNVINKLAGGSLV